MSDSLLLTLLDRGTKASLVPPAGPANFHPVLPQKDLDDELHQPEDGVEDIDRNEHILGERLVIQYVNSKGEESKRRIALHCAFERNGQHYLRAYCYERSAVRTFRSDRIAEIIDATTGEIVEDLTDILERVADKALPLDSLQATDYVFKLQKSGILILLFLARCDGLTHPSEEDVILSYIDHCCVQHGVDEDRALARLRRLSPDPISYERAIRHLGRFNRPELGRVARFARRLIDADGAITEQEATFGVNLDQNLRDPV